MAACLSARGTETFIPSTISFIKHINQSFEDMVRLLNQQPTHGCDPECEKIKELQKSGALQ